MRSSKIINRKVGLLLLVLLAVLNVHASDFLISGTVCNGETGKAVNAVSVKLLSYDGIAIASTTTDAKGRFRLQHVAANDYLLTFYAIGYDSAKVSIHGLNENYDLGEVTMLPKSYELKEVSVYSQSMSMNADRMTFFPSGQVREKSQDAIDVMRLLNMPELKFDLANHTFSSLRNGALQIRIDGVVSTQQDLEAVQPQDIAKIEYITNPGIIYGDNVAAVILVKTKRKFTGLQGGSRVSQALTTAAGSQYAYLTLSRPHDRYSLQLSDSYNYSGGNYSLMSKSLSYPNRILDFATIGDSYRNHYDLPSAQFDYTHSFGERSFMNIRAKYGFSHNQPGDMTSEAYTDESPFYTDITRSRDNEHNTSLDVYYTNTTSTGKQLDANLTATYIATDYKYGYNKAYAQSDNADYSNSYDADGKHGSIIGEIKYSVPVFGKHHLTFGSRNSYSLTRNNYFVDEKKTPSHLDVFLTHDYVEFSGNLYKVNYTVGGGLAYYYFRNDALSKSYTFFRPRLSLYVPLSKVWSLQYYLGINPNEPSLSLLADVIQPVSEYEKRKGNPELRPYQAYMNRLSLNFVKGKTYCALMGYVQYNSRPYIDNPVVYDAATDKFVYSMSNQGHFLHVQTQLYASQRLFQDKLSISAYCLMNHYVNHADAFQNHYTAFIAGGSISYDGKAWGLSASCLSLVRTLFGETKTTQHASLQLSAYCNVKKLRISLSANNPFMPHAYSQRTMLGSHLVKLCSTTFSKANNNYISLTVSYTFSKGKNKEYRQNIQNTDIDSGIMK